MAETAAGVCIPFGTTAACAAGEAATMAAAWCFPPLLHWSLTCLLQLCEVLKP